MTVRRPGKPLVAAARALGADRRKLVPKFSDDAALSRRAEVSVSRPCLEWPAKSPDWRDSGRSAVSAGISRYAPYLTPVTPAQITFACGNQTFASAALRSVDDPQRGQPRAKC